MNFEHKSVLSRYNAIAIIMLFIGFAIIGKAMHTMTVKRDYWLQAAKRETKDSVVVSPVRGNILSSDGQLMASSLPEYKIFMDFECGGLKKDSMWCDSVDLICEGLHRIFPEKTAEEFKRDLEEGHRLKKRHWPIWKYRIDFNTYCEVKSLPLFRQSKNFSGFHFEPFNTRSHPFGSLAQRTIGGILVGDSGRAYCGIELSYDSILRGTNGIKHRSKVMDKYLDISDVPPIDGADIITTIDVSIQDMAERALVKELREKDVNGELGVCIVMEVETGDIKAIVNMSRLEDGDGNVLRNSNGEVIYAETVNNAVSYRCEPGSVFKTASIMAALDDGVIDTSYVIHTGGGVYEMHGRPMRDHNWRSQGGYGDINVARSLEVSSNIGVSYVIDKFYGKNPERYVQALDRIGMREDLHLPIVGYRPPIIRMPIKDRRGGYTGEGTNWSLTALPWMSIGYETQVAPINTVAFYNAIANNGKMMRPRFVKKVVKDGETIAEFPPEVIKEKICKTSTLKTMQTILHHVVSQGLGKPAGNPNFSVSGKTGTAQVSQGKSGYTSGRVGYWLSFAGYFPSEKPKYSMIVCIKKYGTPASGGGMSGKVFREVSEGIMAHSVKYDIHMAEQSQYSLVPESKRGNNKAAGAVIAHLGTKNKPVSRSAVVPAGHMPDVTGMGARDAVHLLESIGLRVRIKGVGKVRQQSIDAGRKVTKGQVCELTLKV